MIPQARRKSRPGNQDARGNTTFVHPRERRSDLIPPERGALKLKAAANYLSVSVPTMHRLIGRGLIRPNRALRHLLFPLSELHRFLNEGQ
jgi:excisionase family DNA binding protein